MASEKLYGNTLKYVPRTKNKYAKTKFSGQSRASWLPNPQKGCLS